MGAGGLKLVANGAGFVQTQRMADAPDLLVVMPVFNERASVRKVVTEWFHEVNDWTERFCFLVIDDGSEDGTPEIVRRLIDQLGDRLELRSRENRGHGQSCLEGYRAGVERGVPFLFQIDSDGQCDPQFFFRLWRERERFDVIYGHRKRRDDGWRRVAASLVLKMVLRVVAGVWCADANTPYRLMRTDAVAPYLPGIPSDFFLANVALAVLLRRETSIRHGRVPIRFRERYGGEPSVPLGNFGARASELVRQLAGLC